MQTTKVSLKASPSSFKVASSADLQTACTNSHHPSNADGPKDLLDNRIVCREDSNWKIDSVNVTIVILLPSSAKDQAKASCALPYYHFTQPASQPASYQPASHHPAVVV